ncbi:hypothetical protein [Sinorhizobium meliloti]|uniref:hypothetical protein n=1 Tax=Rhizobium meliloti TaxID=382 RepID=UPI0019140054|nr:hypothetical protein [Sinorhizobium meliloti]
MADTAATVFRDYETDNVPSSGAHEVKKSDVRAWGAWVESIITAFMSSGGLIYSSKAALDADLAHAANSMAWVIGDATVANNGIYRKIGASGVGSWTRVADLPFSFIIASDTGAGTPNAIQATTSVPVSSSALVWLNVFEENTASPVTVSFNGGPALTIKTNSGNDVAVGGLTAGMIVMGIVSGTTFRLVSDQASSAIVAAAEAAQAAAEAAQAAAEAAAASVTLPSAVAGTYLRQKSDVTGYETVTAQQVREDIDPAGQVLNGDGLKLTYHKARGSWHVAAFGSSLTSVGAGSTAADQAALAAAMASQEMVDIDGTILQIEDPITINYSSANISARKSGRVGDAATSKIKLMDDTMPYLFDCQATNFEASGFAVNGNATNTTTIAFHFKRPDGSGADIDSVLKDIVVERAAKAFHIYGRGLEIGDCTFAEMKTCAGDIDWPSAWTPNGESNDTQETGMRAYHFYNTRLHGNLAGFRNIGANAQNMRGLIIDGALADIGSGGVGGGGIFIGVLGEGSVLNNFVANISASIAGGLVNLHAGSRASVISNFTCRGIKSGVTRVLRTPITIATTVANPVYDVVFANGSLGVCNRDGVLISGAGTAYITLNGVMFDRTNMESVAYAPVRVIEDSAGAMTDVWIKMSNCNFRFGGELVPTAILGGLNSANIHLRRDYTTTKPAAIAWAGGLVDNIGP